MKMAFNSSELKHAEGWSAMSSSGLGRTLEQPDADIGLHPPRSRLWLWFVAAFLIQTAAWIAWFTIAAKHRVAEVPLAAAEAAEHRTSNIQHPTPNANPVQRHR
jgi:hypothetical protein